MNISPATSRLCPPRRICSAAPSLDTWTGLLAGDACKDFVEDEMMINVPDKWGRQWLRSGAGKDWLELHDMPRNPPFAPDRECKASDPHPVLEFSNINETSVITNPTLPISAVIDVKNGSFTSWQLEYGTGQDPSQWNLLAQGTNSVPSPGRDLYLESSRKSRTTRSHCVSISPTEIMAPRNANLP